MKRSLVIAVLALPVLGGNLLAQEFKGWVRSADPEKRLIVLAPAATEWEFAADPMKPALIYPSGSKTPLEDGLRTNLLKEKDLHPVLLKTNWTKKIEAIYLGETPRDLPDELPKDDMSVIATGHVARIERDGSQTITKIVLAVRDLSFLAAKGDDKNRFEVKAFTDDNKVLDDGLKLKAMQSPGTPGTPVWVTVVPGVGVKTLQIVDELYGRIHQVVGMIIKVSIEYERKYDAATGTMVTTAASRDQNFEIPKDMRILTPSGKEITKRLESMIFKRQGVPLTVTAVRMKVTEKDKDGMEKMIVREVAKEIQLGSPR